MYQCKSLNVTRNAVVNGTLGVAGAATFNGEAIFRGSVTFHQHVNLGNVNSVYFITTSFGAAGAGIGTAEIGTANVGVLNAAVATIPTLTSTDPHLGTVLPTGESATLGSGDHPWPTTHAVTSQITNLNPRGDSASVGTSGSKWSDGHFTALTVDSLTVSTSATIPSTAESLTVRFPADFYNADSSQYELNLARDGYNIRIEDDPEADSPGMIELHLPESSVPFTLTIWNITNTSILFDTPSDFGNLNGFTLAMFDCMVCRYMPGPSGGIYVQMILGVG